MGLVKRLDRVQRRHPAAGFPLAVLYKYFDDQGGYLAALIAYYPFVSLSRCCCCCRARAGVHHADHGRGPRGAVAGRAGRRQRLAVGR